VEITFPYIPKAKLLYRVIKNGNEMENVARELGLQINQGKTKYMIVERKNTLKQKNNRTFENKKLQI
jgi:hypothetical protein